MINKILKKIIIIFILINFSIFPSYSNTTILMKINDEIITNIDLNNEKQFLLLLNPMMQNLSKNQIEEIAKSSLINRKIKEIELVKYFEIDGDFGNIYLENFIKNSSFKNKETFNARLNEYKVEHKNFNRV